jgi:hypothetical protein
VVDHAVEEQPMTREAYAEVVADAVRAMKRREQVLERERGAHEGRHQP